MELEVESVASPFWAPHAIDLTYKVVSAMADMADCNFQGKSGC